jgi:hypothetical protein
VPNTTKVQPMNSLKYYKTLYLGVEDTAEVINTDDIILLDDHVIWSYSDLVGILSDEFWKTGFQYLQGIRSGPRKVKLLITNLQATGLKCNPNNKNTSIETIEWFLNNMVTPPGGIILSIYFYKNQYPGIFNPWVSQTIWPTKRQWIGDGDYITVQLLSPNTSLKKGKLAKRSGHQGLIENIEKYCPYPVKYISYKDGEEQVLNSLIHTKRHFTYRGGSYFLSSMTNAPTICYGYPLTKQTGPIYDIKTVNWPDKNDRKKIEYEMSGWNSSMAGLPGSRVCHFDIEKQLCIQKPQTYIRHCRSKRELLGYITFSQELEILHRDRKDWTDISDLKDYPT